MFRKTFLLLLPAIKMAAILMAAVLMAAVLLAACAWSSSKSTSSPAGAPSPAAKTTATVQPARTPLLSPASTSLMNGMQMQGTEMALQGSSAANGIQVQGTQMVPMPMDNTAQAGTASFSHAHMEPGPHMRMAAMPAPTQADRQRADEIAQAAYQALSKYRDYHAALNDGYTIFAPDVPQDVYHFIRYTDLFSNIQSFDPTRPTALLYKKVGQGYEWVGVMYSAPVEASEAELNSRFPLSMAQWHAHTNICVPQNLENYDSLASDLRFGFEGSIDARAECSAAGGMFYPDVLGWMVHVNFADFPFTSR